MLPAHRVPAVEIVRAGEGERNAEAGGEEEELLHHFSQPRAFLGLQGAPSGGQEWLPPYTASPPHFGSQVRSVGAPDGNTGVISGQ